MSPAIVDCFFCSLANIHGRIKIRLTDFEVDDIAAFCLKGFGAGEDFESGLGTKATHAGS
jgi:hypothetical protein